MSEPGWMSLLEVSRSHWCRLWPQALLLFRISSHHPSSTAFPLPKDTFTPALQFLPACLTALSYSQRSRASDGYPCLSFLRAESLRSMPILCCCPAVALRCKASLKQEAFQVWLQQNGQIEMLQVSEPRRMNEKFL